MRVCHQGRANTLIALDSQWVYVGAAAHITAAAPEGRNLRTYGLMSAVATAWHLAVTLPIMIVGFTRYSRDQSIVSLRLAESASWNRIGVLVCVGERTKKGDNSVDLRIG
jgi:hypothetical protein